VTGILTVYLVKKAMAEDILVEIESLTVRFTLNGLKITAVDDVQLSIYRNEIVCLIGESGSGKSILGMALIKLLPSQTEIEGKVLFNGIDLIKLNEREINKIRGREIAWIPQAQSSSLNPTMRVGFQVGEPLETHCGIDRISAIRFIIKLFNYLDIHPPLKRAMEYPYQYSGGMRQRALVAMGLSTEPKLIIADEPTKGIDLIRRKQVKDLLEKAREKSSILVITHDLKLSSTLADRVAVMYCGKILEVSEAKSFFHDPLHPYSKALLSSIPSRGLRPIKGKPPNVMNPPHGCRFHPRCDSAQKICSSEDPPFKNINGSSVRCWLYE